MMTLEELLQHSLQQNASDLHISAGKPPIFRINDELISLTSHAALNADATKKLIYSVLYPEQIQFLEKELEMDCAISLSNGARFRVNIFHQIHGLAAVFRTIPNRIPTLDALDFPAVFKELLQLTHGLILVTGPTGSGKSTTLAAMIDHINTHHTSHIITIEDPIEFIHTSKKSLVNQREVHRNTHHFSNALRSALREDPDIILLGEMRDLETIRLALTAAETGHLVMATLHTNSAPRAINRIVDVFPGDEKNTIRNMLSESLQAVICQTLVKKIAGGRMPAFEIMIGTSAIRNLIREDKIAQMISTIQTSSNSGMCTFEQYVKILVEKKIILPVN